MLISNLDLRYINKAVDYVENVQGYKVSLIKEKKMCETYIIDAKYGRTDEWYKLEVNVLFGSDPVIVTSEKL